MTTKNIYERVAEQHGTTPDEVKQEMQKALSIAGIDMEPELFVSLVANQVLHKAKENPHA